MPDQQNWSLTRLEKEYRHIQGRYRPLLLDPLAQAAAGKTCLSLTSRAVSSKSDRNAVHTQDPPLICGGLGRRSVMTILQKLLQSGDEHGARGSHRLGHRDQAVRHTEAWEHETFAEEQARWERSDPEYARICEAAREAKDRGEEASRRADEAKAKWDARVATQRQANDDALRAHHVIAARESHHDIHTTFAIECNHSPAPGIMPEPVRVHDEPVAMTAPPGQAARRRYRAPATRNPVTNEPTKLQWSRGHCR